jgi:hypothetical protein
MKKRRESMVGEAPMLNEMMVRTRAKPMSKVRVRER